MTLGSDLIVVGIVDSGLNSGITHWAAKAFPTDAAFVNADEDKMAHGAVTLDIIHSMAPNALLAVAQVFFETPVISTRSVAAALDWLLERGARIVNMSLATRSDSRVLRESCAHAVRAGCLLVASVPARGPKVFPAAYNGVLRITGDARCSPEQFSAVGSARIDFGACPLHLSACAAGTTLRGGSSIATARVTGALAALMAGGADPDMAVQSLTARCAFKGVQSAPVPAREYRGAQHHE